MVDLPISARRIALQLFHRSKLKKSSITRNFVQTGWTPGLKRRLHTIWVLGVTELRRSAFKDSSSVAKIGQHAGVRLDGRGIYDVRLLWMVIVLTRISEAFLLEPGPDAPGLK
jgi:hypothetical protein